MVLLAVPIELQKFSPTSYFLKIRNRLVAQICNCYFDPDGIKRICMPFRIGIKRSTVLNLCRVSFIAVVKFKLYFFIWLRA